MKLAFREHRRDGQSEIMPGSDEERIRSFVSFDKCNWDEFLVNFEVAYSSSANATTISTPFYLSYRIDPVTIPLDLLSSLNPPDNDFLRSIQKSTEQAHEAIKRSYHSIAEYANKKRIPVEYEVGNLVYLSTENTTLEKSSGARKFHSTYYGPV